MKLASWHSPKTIRRAGGLQGLGLFALEPIDKDELMGVKTGHLVDEAYVKTHADFIKGDHWQITDELFYSSTSEAEHLDILIGFNHSCEPNAYVDGQVLLRAMRDIETGEEVTVDYAMYFTSDTMEFDCKCQAASCRKHIKPSIDWRNPKLQTKYKGYFTDFIQEKIDGRKRF